MRKILAAVILSLVMVINMTAAFAEDTGKALIEGAQLENGIVKASYHSESGKKLKVMVTKGDKTIYYNLRNDGTAESFPLQLGNGDYKVSIMENIEGKKYKYITTESFMLDLNDQNAVYLASIQNINWNSSMEAVKKAKELTEGLKSNQEKIKAIYDYMVNNVKYDHEKLKNLTTDYIPSVDDTYKTNKGICYDYSSTFAAMLRSVGIPAKLVKGYSDDVNGYHAWNEVYNSVTKSWEIIDTTYDAQMKSSKNKYAMVKKPGLYTKVNEY